ncbi:cysteine-rich receptor-like protein kinase 34 isoform X2 [Magnolia sinica]|uniref:cysteine-rich receptor-like protein kinase 34 isoform X2 n=1 Tax=Magnolia sinica TaxID=86752 RepID=UPI00265932E6|nr:cysteine-rich receptor-like protein kinase 34 isoform X2 [Magnolia sinica]
METTSIVVITIVSALALLLISIICFCLLMKKKAVRATDDIGDGEDIRRSESLLFDLLTLRAATDNFSDANKLGQGGFGSVYKGMLLNGQEVAVKRLARKSRQGVEELKNELVLVAKLQHRNLVKLLGCCVEEEERILVYEYVPNTSLNNFLFDPVKRLILNWDRRYKIISGIARGLLYLHEDSRLRIIHRDLKASNILLDGDMNPKISDFGLAKLFGVDQTQGNTNRIAGTYGYMAPEYAKHGKFSTRSDVFSFGVLVLEIVSGRKNSAFHDRGTNLVSHAWKLWNEGSTMRLVDQTLGEVHPVGEVLRCIHMGLLCVQEDATKRPTMSMVLLSFSSNSMTLPAPMQPAYFVAESSIRSGILETEPNLCAREWDESSGKPVPCSVNDVTISELEAR